MGEYIVGWAFFLVGVGVMLVYFLLGAAPTIARAFGFSPTYGIMGGVFLVLSCFAVGFWWARK